MNWSENRDDAQIRISISTGLTIELDVNLSEDFFEDVKSLNAKIYLVGDGYSAGRKLLGDEYSYETPEKLRYQSAYSVAQIAYKKYLDGDRTSAEELRPTYLRLPQAERDRLEKTKGGKGE